MFCTLLRVHRSTLAHTCSHACMRTQVSRVLLAESPGFGCSATQHSETAARYSTHVHSRCTSICVTSLHQHLSCINLVTRPDQNLYHSMSRQWLILNLRTAAHELAPSLYNIPSAFSRHGQTPGPDLKDSGGEDMICVQAIACCM